MGARYLRAVRGRLLPMPYLPGKWRPISPRVGRHPGAHSDPAREHPEPRQISRASISAVGDLALRHAHTLPSYLSFLPKKMNRDRNETARARRLPHQACDAARTRAAEPLRDDDAGEKERDPVSCQKAQQQECISARWAARQPARHQEQRSKCNRLQCRTERFAHVRPVANSDHHGATSAGNERGEGAYPVKPPRGSGAAMRRQMRRPLHTRRRNTRSALRTPSRARGPAEPPPSGTRRTEARRHWHRDPRTACRSTQE